jgi:hypothetical protein
MKILPVQITESGPGVDLSNLPTGLSVRMADPVKDFAYARNAVTLVFDLSAYEHVRLSFAAMEFGDEPHAPPPSPFGDDALFDGVAISANGVAWYEVQDLRNLRSDRFTPFDLDLDAAIAQWGLSYGTTFRIRFCQYDNNPAPMDGVFIHKIELTGETHPPYLHLPMDDNSLDPIVHDVAAGQHHQTLNSPGDPNTNAHSVPGRVGNALQLAQPDSITMGNVLDPLLAEERDVTVCFWWKSQGAGGTTYDHLVSNYIGSGNCLYWYTYDGNLYCAVARSIGTLYHAWTDGDDGLWHHYALVRRGRTIEFWRDGTLDRTDTTDQNAENLATGGFWIGACGTGGPSAGCVDDFRVYDRALFDWEIEGMSP